MRGLTLAIVLLAALLVATLTLEEGCAGPGLRVPPPAPESPTPAPRATIADVAWLTGYWAGEGMGGSVESVWMPRQGGVMLGSFRLSRPAGTPGSFYELSAIEEHEGSLRFVAKHFTTDWVGWEEKGKAFTARLTRLSDSELAFGAIVMRRDGAEGLVVEYSRRGRDGTPETEALRLKRKAI